MEYGLCWKPNETKYFGDNHNEGIRNAFFLIGDNSVSVKKFDGFLRSIGHEGETGFIIRFKRYNYSNCYSTKPEWLEKWFNERNWSEAEAEIKEGYN